MHDGSVFYTIFLIFAGAAFLSTLVLYTKQSLLVAYILLGAMLGPWGLKLVSDISIVKQIGDVGIVFLLFLLGLHLQPQNLIHMLRKVTWIALISSILFALTAYWIGRFFGLTVTESWILGASMMFSSTIIGLKLLPTTILHHQHTGEVMISVLLMQDVIAIIVLILINGVQQRNELSFNDIILVGIALPALCIFAFAVEKYVLIRLLARFDRTQEYVFLLSIGWCLGLSVLAQKIGLSEDIGAFIAGVALAASPISLFIAESLKPLRDFFLVMFFFSIGATFNFDLAKQIVMPALILSALILLIKPFLFYFLLNKSGEKKQVAKEVGVRLGQASEFSLLVASIAFSTQLISDKASNLIQATTILTFIVSSYFVVLKYPTPIALSDKMRKD
ncbi:cation:proton antiporter [Legionella longbeachae]|uniref:Sodium/hydrogen antiporter n=1 Tax=Legionella longbeachae serogroup 1 (strain NSW150) TaxID=661367 RepID=D3HT99_LEGLN|nr:cation:proton antiporter [Legionella longbeachae]VEE02632.1 sodium/hydrogen antiporter [Legionella oakridgensis]HBD7397895.1 cation:proton antiporter [Legionella pneumophila]ARB91101.1 cation:proton antiporter [Legionella longbeachae]ARM32471.1 cation:proton antiporter [Legionella longbeachae]EEZ94717.1 sodium/hydrogen antiporter family protein [Legionella longbeachae D-4968]